MIHLGNDSSELPALLLVCKIDTTIINLYRTQHICLYITHVLYCIINAYIV